MNAYRSSRELLNQPSDYYNFFSKYKEDLFNHGVDRKYEEVFDMLEVNSEIMKHKEFLDSFGWITNMKQKDSRNG